MSTGRRVRFACDGLSLEGSIHTPAGTGPQGGAVICHPHPLYGGTKDNSVVVGVADALARNGFTTLRFNFRGVGGSGGEHGGGQAERADVAAAIDYLAGSGGVHGGRIAVVGYSFGAAVGLPVGCADSRVAAVAAVAPPLARFPMDDLGSCPKPKLALAGSADAYCPRESFRVWFERLVEPKEFLILAGADHFLGGREEEVGRTVAAFLIRSCLAPRSTPDSGSMP